MRTLACTFTAMARAIPVCTNNAVCNAHVPSPYIGTEEWTSALNLSFATNSSGWRPWTVDGGQQMAGYVTEYEKNFTFMTIRGAGHM